MISTFLLAIILLLMCFASFIVGVAIVFQAFKNSVESILNEDTSDMYKLTRIKKLFSK